MTTKTYKILVVDDTEATRYAIVRNLQKEGFETIEAANGTDALNLLKTEMPDLITLDIHLPDMSGFDVCRKIKRDSHSAHIPVLQISASYVTSKDRITGLEGGADAYFTHPFDPPVLIATVKALIRSGQLLNSLRVQEERTRLATETANIGTWDFNPQTDERVWSNRMKEIMCYPIDFEPTREAFIKRVHPDDVERLKAQIELSLLPHVEAEYNVELRIITPKNEIRWLQAKGTAFFEGEGPSRKAVRFVGTILDTTDTKNIQETIQHAKDLAEKANKAKSQFLANISHEIRTPLGIILGFGDLILDPTQSPSDRQNFMMAIKRNAQQLAKLIDDILDISKIEAERIEVEHIRFSLTELLDEMNSLLRLKAETKGLKFEIKIINSLPSFLTTDPTRLKQILINLVGNAIKFTSEGSITLSVELLSPATEGSPVQLEFSVTDTGIGIKPSHQGRLFEPFMQANASISRNFGGTGLGLMLSKKLAETLGGDLFLKKSELNKGSTFAFTLNDKPLQGGIFQAMTTKISPDFNVKENPQPLKNMNVLVVDDSADNQDLVRILLKNVGAAVEVAENGQQGIDMAMNNNFHAILMDIQMPVVDGYQAVKSLRQLGYKKPIIALTAYALKDEREKCLQNGFNEYLTKPINRNHLVRTLTDVGLQKQ